MRTGINYRDTDNTDRITQKALITDFGSGVDVKSLTLYSCQNCFAVQCCERWCAWWCWWGPAVETPLHHFNGELSNTKTWGLRPGYRCLVQKLDQLQGLVMVDRGPSQMPGTEEEEVSSVADRIQRMNILRLARQQIHRSRSDLEQVLSGAH